MPWLSIIGGASNTNRGLTVRVAVTPSSVLAMELSHGSHSKKKIATAFLVSVSFFLPTSLIPLFSVIAYEMLIWMCGVDLWGLTTLLIRRSNINCLRGGRSCGMNEIICIHMGAAALLEAAAIRGGGGFSLTGIDHYE